MKCQIRWLDRTGRPTPDDNDAVAMAHALTPVWAYTVGRPDNRIIGYDDLIRGSWPICQAHLDRAIGPDFQRSWRFTPLTYPYPYTYKDNHTMTKKHFIVLAECLQHTRPKEPVVSMPLYQYRYLLGATTQWEQDRDTLAGLCASLNPRFNRARWLDYIDGKRGPGGGAR